MTEQYNHQQIEPKWRKIWEDTGLFQNTFFTEEENGEVTPDNKYYILPQLPYPSGSGLHVGHAEVYTACDIYSRFQRMQGKKVLQVIGWDSFGLPAENYAIKTNIHPKINTEKAIETFIDQIKTLGISVDWSRTVGSHTPEYYKFTQWFFLFMYERGLAYRKKQSVNWCDGCKTVLANEQVVNGKCERCSTEVVQRDMEQWYLKITDYADRLYDDLDKVDWPEESVKRQRDWIGRSRGINIDYDVVGSDKKITCFTTTPVNFGATFIVLAPEHPIIDSIVTPEQSEIVKKYRKDLLNVTELDRQQKEKTGVFTGAYVRNHVTGESIPVWIANFVMMNFGTGAVQGCPGHDERDWEFANKYGIAIKRVVVGPDGDMSDIDDKSKIISKGMPGKMVNSDFLNGLEFASAMEKTMDYFESKGWGQRKTNFKLRDWSVSRQRFWGAPIPMVYDPEGNLHPVSFEDLPVQLPDDVDFKPTGQSPLTYSPKFQEGVEEKYGKGWRREVDTLDTFMCSSWYYYRYLDPRNDKEFASKDVLKRWMPIDFYLGGPEHVNGHLLYSRFFTKVLYDAGIIDFDEPFKMHKHQGLIYGEDGRKMSKRWGNVINPTDVVATFGADTCRTYEMFMGPLEDDKPWSTNGVKGVRRFYSRIWNLMNEESKFGTQTSEGLRKDLHKTIKKVGDDIALFKFNTAIARMMEFVNYWEKKDQVISKEDAISFVKILAPFGPYISEELYSKLTNNSETVEQNRKSVHVESWPVYDESLVTDSKVTIAVQINGKLKGLLKDIQADLDESTVKDLATKLPNIANLNTDSIVKTIFVQNKLINFVVR